MTLGEMLEGTARACPAKTAVIDQGESTSFVALDAQCTRLARWFVAQGLKPGDRVAIHWPNSRVNIQLYFAVFRAGLIAVPVNLRMKAAELAYVLAHSGAVLCFSEPGLADLARAAAAECPALREVRTSLPEESCAAELPAIPLPSITDDQVAILMYTSGTTAKPKGVTHSHRTILAGVRLILQSGFIRTDEVAVTMAPFVHASGLMVILLPCIQSGATLVTLPGFHPGAVLDAIERHGGTCAITLPALMQMLVEEQVRHPRRVGTVSFGAAGGDAVPLALQNGFQAAFGVPLLECYAMTESLPISRIPAGAQRPGSMGVAPEGVAVLILDPLGRELAEGETGELVVRSAANCLGYWNDPEATRDLFRGGWLHTGDLASRDAEGYLWFKGRIKQIIVRAGSNVSPQEVEEALYRHPAVLEAGVVGQPDALYGEVVVAYAVLRAGMTASEEELREFAREGLADYKVPERIVFFDALPKGLTGKVDRRRLKELTLAAARAPA